MDLEQHTGRATQGELSETSCIDVGDWIHSLQCPMGDLSNGSSSWWRELLQCLDRFYNAYLESSNLAKLNLKLESFATAMVKEDKWSRVDKRATSMILAALPEAVRAEALALRLTGTLAVLGRIMVLYRPGSAAERQQTTEGPGKSSDSLHSTGSCGLTTTVGEVAKASGRCWSSMSRCKRATQRTGRANSQGAGGKHGDPVQVEHDEVHAGD